MKGNRASIHFQNCQLYIFGILANLSALLYRNEIGPSAETSLFHGFNAWAVVVVVANGSCGLAVSFMLRYADSIAKTYATALAIPATALGSYVSHPESESTPHPRVWTRDATRPVETGSPRRERERERGARERRPRDAISTRDARPRASTQVCFGTPLGAPNILGSGVMVISLARGSRVQREGLRPLDLEVFRYFYCGADLFDDKVKDAQAPPGRPGKLHSGSPQPRRMV